MNKLNMTLNIFFIISSISIFNNNILFMEVESHAIHGKYMTSASCNHLTEFTWYPANSCGRLGSTGPYVIHKGSMDVNGISKYVRKTTFLL